MAGCRTAKEAKMSKTDMVWLPDEVLNWTVGLWGINEALSLSTRASSFAVPMVLVGTVGCFGLGGAGAAMLVAVPVLLLTVVAMMVVVLVSVLMLLVVLRAPNAWD